MGAKLSTYCLFLALGGIAFQPRQVTADPVPGRVKVSIVTILATTRDEPVDQRLKCIAEQVRKKEKTLRGFKLIDMTCASLAVGQEHTFKLIDKQKAVVVVRHGADKDNWVELKVKPPLRGEIVYRTVCGKCLPILTGYKTKDKGDWLLLAILVKPCHQKK